jgi:hypothetical protein
MELALVASERGTKVFQDQKHVKTIAKKYALVYNKVSSKLTIAKKRPNPKERNLLEIALHWQKYLEKLAISEPAIFSYVKETFPVCKIIVIPLSGKERTELQLNNGVKINCPNQKLASFFPEPLPIYQNY